MTRLFFLIFVFLLAGCGSDVPISAEATTQRETPTSSPATEEATQPVPTPAPTAIPASSNGDADVEFVRAVLAGTNTWTFHVTVAHPDIGWDDYADGWDVLLPDGSVIRPDEDSPFTRLIAHPHETEQPFTRAQSNIVIPDSITSVRVRAHDIVDGFGGAEVLVDLNSAEGDNYKVEK